MSAHRDTVSVLCTANVCRSPMAAALLAHALAAEPEPWRSLRVVSAGLSAWPGEEVSEHTVLALRKVGLNLEGHRSRQVTEEMLESSVLVLVMTESHRQALREAFPELAAPILLWRELLPGEDPEIPDPYGFELSVYTACRDSMVEAIPAIVKHLKTIHPPQP